MSEQVLTIDLNEEYKIKIENPKDFEISLFRDVYERAAKATADIIEQTSKLDDTKDTFQKERQEYNNIIAFTGDRGTGKTSAMVSFAQYLLNNGYIRKETDIKGTDIINSCDFISIPTIDPSLFEKDENIMEVMLAQMFSQFEDKIKQNESNVEPDKKRKLLEIFEKVYENLQTIKRGTHIYDGEAIETLSKLACSTKLRENFKKLVLEYISFFNNSSNDNSKKTNCFLIIPIDDFDLNVKGAVEMSEQIRKYFMIPNVIILMSVNMSQLKDAKELSIRKEFKDVLETMEENPSKMAVQYLLKLIPDNRRLYMPNIDVNINNIKITIKDKKATIVKEQQLNNCILGGIYQKTGLIFLSDNYKSHILISYNLRKLKELIVLIYGKMSNTNENYKYINYNLFENYFTNNIINDYTDNKTRDIFIKIKETRPEKRNYYTIQLLISELKETHTKHIPGDYKIKNNTYFFTPRHQDSNESYTPKNNHDQEFCDLIDKLNHYSNISVGDLFYMLKYYKDFINDKHSSWLLKSLEVLYSLEIYKYLFIETNPNVVQNIIGESFLPSPYLERIIPQKDSNQERLLIEINLDHVLSNGTTINSQLKNIIANPNIELFSFLINYFGSEYSTRRKSETPTYRINGIVNNLANYKLAIINILSPFILELCPIDNIRRFTNFYKQNTGITEFNKSTLTDELNEWQKTYKCTIPLYSIDLLNRVFENKIEIKDASKNNLYEDISDIYTIIFSRIRRITTETVYLTNEYDSLVKESKIINTFQKNEFTEFFQSVKQFNPVNNYTHLQVLKTELKLSFDKFKRVREYGDYVRNIKIIKFLTTEELFIFINTNGTSYTTTSWVQKKISELIDNLKFRNNETVQSLPIESDIDPSAMEQENNIHKQIDDINRDINIEKETEEKTLEPDLISTITVAQHSKIIDSPTEG
jgi:hypothetical protein